MVESSEGVRSQPGERRPAARARAADVLLPGGEEALPDEEVVLRIRAGEHALFELLMRRHNRRVYRAARSIVKDDDEAEDVMQQAYVNAYTHLDQFEERARFSTWLTRIAVHEALARVRKRSRTTEVDMSDSSGPGATLRSSRPDPEQQAAAGELQRVVERALEALPRSSRTLFVMREVEGLSTAETAACLGLTEDVVKTRLHRARLRLRKELMKRAGLVRENVFPFHATRCDRVVAGVFARLRLTKRDA